MSEPTRPLVAWGIVGAAAAAGLVMTLPWAVTLTYPTADHLDHMLPLWVPYLGSTQPLVYAIVYACGAIALLVCAGLMISADAEANELIGGKKHEKLLKLRKTHQFLVRFQCLLFLSATRMALAAAICAGLCVGDIDAADLTGSIAIMLLIQSLLANSTGLVLFVLFGTSDGVFAAPAAWLKAAAGRAEVVALLKVDSEIKDDVVDEIEQAAAGAGLRGALPDDAHAQEGRRRHAHRGQVEARVPTAVDRALVCLIYSGSILSAWVHRSTIRRSRGAPSSRRCRWLASGTDIVSSWLAVASVTSSCLSKWIIGCGERFVQLDASSLVSPRNWKSGWKPTIGRRRRGPSLQCSRPPRPETRSSRQNR